MARIIPAIAAPSRRQTVLGLGAAFLGLEAGCATSPRAPIRVVMNLANQIPLTPAGPAHPAMIRTAVDSGLRMTVPVFLDGHGPFTFVVDSGANVSVLAAEVASLFPFPPGAAVAVHGIAGAMSASTVNVGKLQVGSVTSTDLVMPVLASEALGADGILGVDILKNRLVRLDFRTRQLSIGPSRDVQFVSMGGEASRLGPDDPNETLVSVPARYRFGQLTVVDADVGGLPITAFLDSGSETTVGNLALLRGSSKRRPDLITHARKVQLLSATGQTAFGQLSALPLLRLGGLRLGNLIAVYSDLHAFELWDLADRPALLIGMDILRHFNAVELDFGRRQVRFHVGQVAR
jgi:hypothetical protein